MIFYNKDGENKIFIDESIQEFITIHQDQDESRSMKICVKESNIIFTFCEEKMTLANIEEIFYDADEVRLWFYTRGVEHMYTAEKLIGEDEIISFTLGDVNESYRYININIMKLPMFLFEDDKYEQYPKFEVNLSDCIYSIKIYLSQSEYIEIPYFQSSYHIIDTLKYISDLVTFLKLENPAFLNQLCNNDKMQISIYDKDNTCIGCEVVSYKFGENGLYLTSIEGELEKELVPYNVFFKLVMDLSWEVDFIDE